MVVAALFSTELSISRSREANLDQLHSNALHHSTDDGFYYLGIARNIARGRGSTFDGIHPTNGYHPLWLLSLVPIFWIVDNLRLAFLLATLLEAMLFLLACFLLSRTVKLEHGWPVTVLATLLWIRIQSSHWIFFYGLEYALQTTLFYAAAYFFIRDFSGEPRASDRSCLRLGVLLALCFLARLENGVLAALVIAALLVSLPASLPRKRTALLLAAPLAVTALVYALVNWWMFGHPLPVSGAVKTARSAWLLQADLAGSAQGYIAVKLRHAGSLLTLFNPSFRVPLLFGLLAPAALWATATIAKTRSSRALAVGLRPLLPFTAFAWIQLGLLTLVFHGGESFKPWYFVAPIWLAVLTGASVLGWLEQALAPRFDHARRATLAAAAVLVVVATAFNLGDWRAGQRQPGVLEPLLQEAAWIRDNVPPTAVAASWNAGAVGYFSDRSVVNLDGLVNSWSFFRSHRFDLCRYWQETAIEVLVDMFPLSRELEYMDREYARWSGLESCSARLEMVWRGEAAGSWAPAAFRIGGRE